MVATSQIWSNDKCRANGCFLGTFAGNCERDKATTCSTLNNINGNKSNFGANKHSGKTNINFRDACEISSASTNYVTDTKRYQTACKEKHWTITKQWSIKTVKTSENEAMK